MTDAQMPDTDAEADAQEQDKGLYLNLYNPVRAYDPQDLQQVFVDMDNEMGNKAHKDETWRIVAAQSGSHVPRLIHPRFPGISITFPPRQGNRPRPTAYSGNGANSKYAKVIHRPILIVGDGEAASFYRRITEGLPYADALKRAFAAVFGQGALDNLLSGLSDAPDTGQIAGKHGSTFFNGENFPIVILPGPDGRDVQTTPIPSIESHNAPHQESNRRWENYNAAKKEYDAQKRANPGVDVPLVSYQVGSWIRTDFSGKPQNASPNARKTRLRLLVTLPEFAQADSRRIWAWAQKKEGAAFPPPRMEHLRRLMIAWDSLAQRTMSQDAVENKIYSNQRMKDARDNIAREIGRLARDYIEGIVQMANEYIDQSKDMPTPPSVHALLGRVYFEAADFPKLSPKEAAAEGKRIASRMSQEASVRHLLNEEH